MNGLVELEERLFSYEFRDGSVATFPITNSACTNPKLLAEKVVENFEQDEQKEIDELLQESYFHSPGRLPTDTFSISHKLRETDDGWTLVRDVYGSTSYTDSYTEIHFSNLAQYFCNGTPHYFLSGFPKWKSTKQKTNLKGDM